MSEAEEERAARDESESESEANEVAEEDNAPSAVPEPEPTPADWGYPVFARRFPRDPELDVLVEAFSRGNYLAVREGIPKLLAREELADDVRASALLLRERTEPDRTSRLFFYLAAGLLVMLSLYWLTHDGPEHAKVPPAPSTPQVEFVK